MTKKYCVTLTVEAREILKGILNKGKPLSFRAGNRIIDIL
jgi:hypothetical protein